MASDVKLTDVSKRFGHELAVDSVSLATRPGEFLAFLGPSGCGKTTLLRMIAGLEDVTSGTIEVQGQVVNDVPIHHRPTNMVFQKLALFPHLSVGDNIAFGLKLKRVSKDAVRKRVKDVLELVQLPGFEERRVTALSGGQQQRVAIARAIVNDPKVLLLDEPLGALDLKLQTHLQEELRAIQKRLRSTFIYVTHNQVEAMTMSDRVAVMNEGRVEQIGPVAELYARPATRFVASFLGTTNLLDGVVDALDAGSARIRAGGIFFEVPVVPGMKVGQQVSYSIRPETIILGEGPDAANRLLLALESLSPRGSTTIYRFATPEGGSLIVEALGTPRPFAQGEAVSLGFDRSAPVPLADVAPR